MLIKGLIKHICNLKKKQDKYKTMWRRAAVLIVVRRNQLAAVSENGQNKSHQIRMNNLLQWEAKIHSYSPIGTLILL